MIIDNYREFLDSVIVSLEKSGVDVNKFDLDHIAYQASSSEDFDNLLPEFKKIGEKVSENIVGGRRVGIFRLNNPLIFRHWEIPAIELIEPKTGQICPSALEHAEFVIDTSFEEFMLRYKDINWDTSAINQPVFPMIKLKLTKDSQVKFHLKPVLEIVK